MQNGYCSEKDNFFILSLTPPDVTERLLQINPTLAREARKVLDTKHKQVGASHPGRDGYERKIFASAWIMRQDHPVQSDVPDDFLYILVFGQ